MNDDYPQDPDVEQFKVDMDRSKQRKYSKSTAKSRFLGPGNPGVMAKIEMEECCSLCENAIPDGQLVIRNEYTHCIICVLCVVGLAELATEEMK